LTLKAREDLRPFFRPVIVTLLTRLQANKTDKFVYGFTRFVLFMLALNVEGFTADYIISDFEAIQPR
jgi:exportin-2 (importin alpha re-exporter)